MSLIFKFFFGHASSANFFGTSSENETFIFFFLGKNGKAKVNDLKGISLFLFKKNKNKIKLKIILKLENENLSLSKAHCK